MSVLRERMATWWATVAPERKRLILAIALIGFVMLVAGVFDRRRAETPVAPTQKPKLDMSVVTAPRKDEGVQDLRTNVATLSNQLKTSNATIDALTKQVATLKETNQQAASQQVSELQRDVQNLRQEVRATASEALNGTAPGKGLDLPALPAPDVKAPGAPAAPPAPKKPKLRMADGANTPASGAVTKESKGLVADAAASAPGADGTRLAAGNADVGNVLMQFIPAGTIINGVMLSGIDAPTSGMAQKQPVPALMRVTTLAFLPNNVRQDLRACHVILSGYGVLSSERANLRSEILSCIRNDGGVIETAIDGFAAGADGKQGVRGTLVTKQGSQIARSLFAGFIAGFANIMKPTQIPAINTSGGASWQMPDVGNALQAGAMNGIGGAANDVAKFFLDTAKEMHPVVEVPSETPITLVLLRGTTLALGQKPKLGARRLGAL